ncbi:MAG: CHAT domain-containing protein [Thiolinea sp.]
MTNTEQPATTIKFLLPKSITSRGSGQQPTLHALPRILGGHSRSTDSAHDSFINERAVSVESVYDLSGAGRDGNAQLKSEAIQQNRILVLEATDGTTLIVRADKLKQDLQRLYPDEATGQDGQVSLRALTDQEAAARGLGSWIWSKLSVLGLSPDGLVETAKDKALELLKEKLGEAYEEMVYAGASWAGAKALMWAIESRLVGEPGLYHWHDRQIRPADLVDAENQRLQQAADNDEGILVFIHGTASSTTGSFGDLHSGDDEGNWANLTRKFAGRVYGYEYRSFSNSPLENALILARTLPKHSRISLITHSQGGLIGDLLCLADDFEEELISRYQRNPVLEKEGEFKDQERPENKKLREAIVAEEKEQLRTLRVLLKEKQFKIERYMRVACPASGTTLLSDNLDLFLSSLLSLFNFSVNLIPAVGTVGSTALSAFRRIVLEIAEKRIDPRLIPGIEAMLPNSPLTILLAQAPRRENIDMAVLSGDADGDSGGFLKRIAIMLTDWIIFDHFDNDFVVDTQSMRAGLARRNSTREYYAHGHQVSHVHYFERIDTRRAICKWMNDPEPQKLPIFNPIPTDCDIKFDAPVVVEGQRNAQLNNNAPVVFYLPGIMGSHLEIRKENQGASEGDRVWFDPFHLAAGGIEQLSIDKKNVLPEGLFYRYYGELEAYLRQNHEVITFAYDWRKSIEATAELLSKEIEKKLIEIEEQPQRQLSILAHSMGGLVVRAMLADDAENNDGKLWDRIVGTGGHFVMLGTPNNGSHQMVETLLGKSNAIRQLALIDFQHDLQEIIEIIDDYDGVLQLLPHDQFTDSGVEAAQKKGGHKALKYHQPQTWDLIRKENRDDWFGFKTGLGAKPYVNKLKRTESFWEKLNRHNQQGGLKHANKVAYVYGLAAHTPCGLTLTEKTNLLNLHGTVQGDGSVSWQSGQLGGLDKERYWYMPVPHASLTNSPEYYPAIVDLIRYGKTQQLSQKKPRTRSAADTVYRYEAGPVLQPGAEDLVLSFFGGRPVRDVGTESTLVLDVSVRAMDLRFAQWPVMCGHYLSDSIAGAEYAIDQHLVNGALSQRERLGIYAGEIGTNTIVMNPRSAEQRRRGSTQGAIILGLGEWDQITTQKLVAATYDAVLEYLLHSTEFVGDAEKSRTEDEELNLNSLLICCNSTKHITIASSIEAIVLGICKANQQYFYNKGKNQPKRAIRRLEFIECYMDTAISAAYAIRDLPRRMEKDLQRLNARIVPAQELQFKRGDGARERLSDLNAKSGYWARMMVTNADQDDNKCPDECYDDWLSPNIPQKVLDAVRQQLGQANTPEKEKYPAQEIAERIKYVFMSERARAEALVQQRQPGLIEALIRKSIQDSRYDSNICRTLFQLMVPVDFKSAARQTDQILLVLDGYTANLPWEMLQADEEPFAMRISMVRQLVSTRYRQSVTNSLSKDACVIGNPSTADFHHHFDLGLNLDPEDDHDLPSLSGATKEAQKVTETLRSSGYEVEHLYPAHPDNKPSDTALDVFNILFKKPYRILMIAAHGETRIRAKRDNRERTGVVLSDGIMLTAAEIGQMEVVPDLVFLNCCHLAKADNTPRSYNRLAYSLSRELIEMGVRCVVAAGWAVNDDAALTFSGTFFEAFTSGDTFGKAIFKARRKTYEMHPGLNTWGAYQAYGDPNYLLHTDKEDDDDDDSWQPVAPQELEDRLKALRIDLKQSYNSTSEHTYNYRKFSGKIQRMLNRVPNAWVKKPGIQYILADLYGSMLPEGFEQAAKAYQQAIIEEDTDCHVPIRALELLGNLESRQAETLSEEAEEKRIAANKADLDKDAKAQLLEEQQQLLQKAEQLSSSAITRLTGLLNITLEMYQLQAPGSSDQVRVNVERFALLGGAYKRKAIILLRQSKDKAWTKELQKSIEFYRKGEGVSFDLNFNPYTTINRLQLEGILQITHDNQIILAEKAQAAARQSFEQSLSFFDGVMSADATIAIYLLDETRIKEQAGEQPVKDFLIDCYENAVKGIHYSSREFDSVIKQLEYLSLFLKSHAKNLNKSAPAESAIAAQKADVLSAVATALQKL